MGTNDSSPAAQSTADHLAEGPRSTPESETPTSDRTGLGRYRWLLAGLVLVLIGVASLATFLVAAGVGASGKAGVLAVATVAAFGVGTAVMVAAVRRRRGLLYTAPTPEEKRAYRRQWRPRWRRPRTENRPDPGRTT
ncbi:hypothetical protein EV589_5985 [Mycobacterium sp. BK558]|nr:hypothetical protein EV589_5985 [Mycobacterium sp. BK558]